MGFTPYRQALGGLMWLLLPWVGLSIPGVLTPALFVGAVGSLGLPAVAEVMCVVPNQTTALQGISVESSFPRLVPSGARRAAFRLACSLAPRPRAAS